VISARTRHETWRPHLHRNLTADMSTPLSWIQKDAVRHKQWGSSVITWYNGHQHRMGTTLYVSNIGLITTTHIFYSSFFCIKDFPIKPHKPDVLLTYHTTKETSSTTVQLQRPPDTTWKEHTATKADRCDTQPPDQIMQEPQAPQDPH